MSKVKISLDLKGECLRCVQVKKIADYISETYGLPYVDGVLLRREYSGKYPIPLIVENGDKTMWVDRYYVAYIFIQMEFFTMCTIRSTISLRNTRTGQKPPKHRAKRSRCPRVF